MNPQIITVGLAGRSYDIAIGTDLLDQAGRLIVPLLKRRRIVVATDENVALAQGRRLDAALAKAGISSQTIVLQPGEAAKSFSQLELLVERLAALEVGRTDVVIAFGGGVVGDLTGFAAAVLNRGTRYVQIPTTLLSQVDSSVGGKTAVNLNAGKNLAGAFHQPSLVLIDVSTLKTLPPRELRAGYAEVVKYAALGDAPFFERLERDCAKIFDGEAAVLADIVATCCKMKARIVERDEREQGERALLNLGHTFGHAMESSLCHSERLLHGEAVAAGMGAAFDYAVDAGLCPPSDADRLKRHLKAAGLPSGFDDVAGLPSADILLERMRKDKKTDAGRLALILPRRIGQAFVARDIDEGFLLAFLERRLTAAQRP